MSFEIIVPGRFVEAKGSVNLEVGMEGWYTLSALKDGKVVRKRNFKAATDPFKNMVLNIGLDNFGSQPWSNVARYFSVGTGTSTPVATQTALDARVGSPFAVSSQTNGNSGAPDYYGYRIITALSAVGAFGSANLTEVGVGTSSTTAPELFSRALIVDGVGNPVAFPISSDEQLQISYELRVYPPLTDSGFTVNVSGTRDVIVRALNITNAAYWGVTSYASSTVQAAGATEGVSGLSTQWWAGDLGLITASTPQGSAISSSPQSVTNNAYSNGSYQRQARWSWGSTSANGTLRTHGVRWGCCQFQAQYDPPIVKTSDHTMYLDYRLSWGRR